MYRKIFLLILLAQPIITFSQIDASFYKDGKVTYWAVNPVDSNLTSDGLMKNFNAWWADYTSKYNSLIPREQWKMRETVVEKDANMIIVKGKMLVKQFMNTSVWDFDITVQTKDGRYKYTMTNFGNIADGNLMALGGATHSPITIEQYSAAGSSPGMVDKFQKQVTDIIFSLETWMRKKRPTEDF